MRSSIDILLISLKSKMTLRDLDISELGVTDWPHCWGWLNARDTAPCWTATHHGDIDPGCGQLGEGSILILVLHLLQLLPVDHIKENGSSVHNHSTIQPIAFKVIKLIEPFDTTQHDNISHLNAKGPHLLWWIPCTGVKALLHVIYERLIIAKVFVWIIPRHVDAIQIQQDLNGHRHAEKSKQRREKKKKKIRPF